MSNQIGFPLLTNATVSTLERPFLCVLNLVKLEQTCIRPQVSQWYGCCPVCLSRCHCRDNFQQNFFADCGHGKPSVCFTRCDFRLSFGLKSFPLLFSMLFLCSLWCRIRKTFEAFPAWCTNTWHYTRIKFYIMSLSSCCRETFHAGGALIQLFVLLMSNQFRHPHKSSLTQTAGV